MISIQKLTYAYDGRKALQELNLEVHAGEIFGLLGPNGSGKTTLLRILSTLLQIPAGKVRIDACDVAEAVHEVRRRLGVVFQSSSLDPKLTVGENLLYQGQLYGLAGEALKSRAREMAARFGLEDRWQERSEKLSGGLKRRVEIAKALVHRPALLILDEPSGSLDPGARLDLWHHLALLRKRDGLTILMATHLMEEAEYADRIAIMAEGTVAALGAPEELKNQIGGDVLEIRTAVPADLAKEIEAEFKTPVQIADDALQIEHPEGHRFLTRLVEAFPGRIQSVIFRKPTLADVFMHKTGRHLQEIA